jgi:MFS family permease
VTSLDDRIRSDLPYNFVIHAFDAGFFGLALGLASFVSVVPLFVATMTTSPLLIGLIASVHPLGWHLPQLLTSRRVSRLPRLMPMILVTTISERLPFFALALLALASPHLSPGVVIAGTYLLVLWIGMGGGLTATAFQTLVAKIVPRERRGLFYGVKTASANLPLAVGAVLAGRAIERFEAPGGFALCFALAGVATGISYFVLARTREPATAPPDPPADSAFRRDLWRILRTDANFRWYVTLRVLTQVAIMATAFYIVYGIQELGLTAAAAGVMTGLLALAQTAANPVMGWAGDRVGYRAMIGFGMLCAAAAALVAWRAPSVGWFYLVFTLAGLAYVATWTVPLSMILQFGTDANRASYIGLGNTLFAPSVVLAPLLGGYLAQTAGYGATFLTSAAGAVAAIVVLALRLREPAISR